MPKRSRSPRVHPLPRVVAHAGFAAGVAAVERLLRLTPDTKADVREVLVALESKGVDLHALADVLAAARDQEQARGALDALHADVRWSQRDAADLGTTLRPALKKAVRWYERLGRPEFADVYRQALADVEHGPLAEAARGTLVAIPPGQAGNPAMRRRARLIAALTSLRLANRAGRVRRITQAEAAVLVDALAF